MKDKDNFHLYLITNGGACQHGGEKVNEKIYSEAARMAKREYARQWRRRNPEKVRENNRRYWEKKAAKRKNDESEVKNGSIPENS